jgi:GT2 family glycosyltransferase
MEPNNSKASVDINTTDKTKADAFNKDKTKAGVVDKDKTKAGAVDKDKSKAGIKTAVVILNWNGKALMEQYLPVLIEHTGSPGVSLVVADNASTDGSVEWLKASYPAIQLICLEQNYGFAEGYNRALASVEAEYLVLLNSDVQVSPNWLEVLTDYLDEHPEVAACQPKILSLKQPDYFEHAGACGGFIDALGYPFCRGRIQEYLETDQGQYDQSCDVFWASGACLCIRREDYFSAGGLDARFFAHMEEIDLCWRLRKLGRRLVCLPASVVYHLGGGTLNKENAHKTFLNFRNNLLMLYKNLPQGRLFGVMALRLLLDYSAALSFLLRGCPKSAIAVLRGRMAFRKLRPGFKKDRKSLSRGTQKNIPEIYRGCIVFDYFLRGKKRYSQLKF